MELLQEQFTRRDVGGTGKVSAQDFKESLERFGVRQGVGPVVRKFSDGSGQVKYDEFLQHFGRREQRHQPQVPAPAPAAAAAAPAPTPLADPPEMQSQAKSRDRSNTAPATPPPPSFMQRTGRCGLDVTRGPGRVRDAHRSDSGSLTAFATGDIEGSRTGNEGPRRRGIGESSMRAHDATLQPTIASLSGADDSHSRPCSVPRRGRGTTRSPVRGFDLVSGIARPDAPRLEHGTRPEGKRHLASPAPAVRSRSVGLRTFPDRRECHSSPRGLRRLAHGGESHFSLGSAVPTSGPHTWPEGPAALRITPSTVSAIPGLSAEGEVSGTSRPGVQRKGRTKEPSSFGYQPMPRGSLSPHRSSQHRSSSAPKLPTFMLKSQLSNKVTTNNATVTKAWMDLNKAAGGSGPSIPVERFAEAVRVKYAVDMDADDVRNVMQKDEPISFSDFNDLVRPPQGAGDLLKKERDLPERPSGRKYHTHDNPRNSSPFALRPSDSPARRLRGAQQHHPPPVNIPTPPDHYQTTNMRAYSPLRSHSPSQQAAGFPNRLRDDSMRRKRCFSPGFTNRESVGNPIVHCC